MKNKNYRLKLEKSLLIIVIIFSLFFINSCTLPESIQVLDKETKKPITEVALYYSVVQETVAGAIPENWGIMFSDKKGRIFIPSLNVPLPMLSGIRIKIFAIGYGSVHRTIRVIPDIFGDIYLGKIKGDAGYYGTIRYAAHFLLNYSDWKRYNLPVETRNKTREFIIKMCEDFIKKFPESKYYNNVLYIMGSV